MKNLWKVTVRKESGKVLKGMNVEIGSRELRNFVFEIQPKFCVFGHNHEKGNKREELENIWFINASVFNDLLVKNKH